MSNVQLECVELETQENIDFSVIWLHGLGADGHDFTPIVPHLGLHTAGVRFIFPHALVRPITINNGFPMRAWYDIDSLDLENRSTDDAVFSPAQDHVHQLIQRENERGIPTNRIILAGFSQGGAVTLYTALRYPETLLGILAISTYLPAPERVESTAHPANKQAPIFLAHGRHDEMINIRHAYRSKETLERLTNPLEWHEYDMGHEVCPEEIANIGRWLSGRFEADQDKQP